MNKNDSLIADSIAYDQLLIIWRDGHESRYPRRWLKDRIFTNEANKERRQRTKKVEPTTSGAEYKDAIKTHEFNSVMQEDKSMLRFLLGA